ncbi:Putative hemolysin [Klebsiella aerogenes EA1509E]|nr:Putative hemolysin [Klebsiella aerogenes EA1509E]
MFSLDNVLDDLWPQARPAPWQKKVLKKLLHEEEFQQFAARHRHLKGLDTVEQVLEHLNIRCAIPAQRPCKTRPSARIHAGCPGLPGTSQRF